MSKNHDLTRAEIDEALDKLGPVFPPGDTKAHAAAKAPPLAEAAAAGAPAPANESEEGAAEPDEPEGDDFKDAIATLVNLDRRIADNKPPRKLTNAIDKAQAAREHKSDALPSTAVAEGDRRRPQRLRGAGGPAPRVRGDGRKHTDNIRDSAFAQKCEEIAQLDFSEPDVSMMRKASTCLAALETTSTHAPRQQTDDLRRPCSRVAGIFASSTAGSTPSSSPWIQEAGCTSSSSDFAVVQARLQQRRAVHGATN